MPAASIEHPARRIRHLDSWSVNDRRFKVYGINPDTALETSALIPSSMLEGARNVLENTVCRHPGEHRSEQAGFVILHKGNIGNWLLINWWADGILLFNHLFRSKAPDIGRFEAAPDGLLACVWELKVVEFERDAWTRSMLRNEGDPNIDAYFAERFNEDW